MIICHYLLLLIFITSLNRWLSISLFSIFFICWFLKKTFFLNKTRFCVWLPYYLSLLIFITSYLYIYHFSQSHYLSLLIFITFSICWFLNKTISLNKTRFYAWSFITSLNYYHFLYMLIIHHYLSLLIFITFSICWSFLSITDYPPLFITFSICW